MSARASMVTLEGDLALSYSASGDPSGAVLVLLPGPTDSRLSYAPVLERLPSSIRALAVSQRGHGDSDKPASGYRVEDFAADVVRFLDALGIERAVLGAHSGSCLVARRVAIDAPERVAGLVLEASPLTLRGDAGLEGFVASVVSGLEDPIDPALARAFVIETSSREVEPAAIEDLTGELLKVPARVWREMFAGLLVFDDTAELERIDVPTLLVWGDVDGLIGREAQEMLARRLPNAELIVYPGVGHTPRWEDPARFAADAAGFVSRVLST